MNLRDLLGIVSPSTMAVAYPSPSDPSPVTSMAPGLAGGIAGLSLCPKHRLLGFLGGEALGGNAYRLWRGQGDDRRRVVGNVGVAGSLIAGSLLWKSRPFWGGVVGFGVGVLATSFVPGTLAHGLFHEGGS